VAAAAKASDEEARAVPAIAKASPQTSLATRAPQRL
jgi:hypothetical protein